MTFPSSSAPLAGISRARLPAWALPDGWPTQANGEPQLADLAFRDGRIAAVTPSVEPAPGDAGARRRASRLPRRQLGASDHRDPPHGLGRTSRTDLGQTALARLCAVPTPSFAAESKEP